MEWSLSGWEVCGGGELGLRFEVADTLAQGREGALERLRPEHNSQRRRTYVNALDEARGHAGRVTGRWIGPTRLVATMCSTCLLVSSSAAPKRP